MAAATLAGVSLLWISTVRKEKEPQVSCQDFTMLLDSLSDFRSYLRAYGFSSGSCTMMINEGSCDFELSASNDEKGIIVPGLVSLQSCPKVTFLVLTHLPSLRQRSFSKSVPAQLCGEWWLAGGWILLQPSARPYLQGLSGALATKLGLKKKLHEEVFNVNLLNVPRFLEYVVISKIPYQKNKLLKESFQ